jgi:hypothetical protein
LAFLFDVPAPVVFAAFAGSCFALAMAEQATILAAITMVAGGTVASAYITPIVGHYFDGYSMRGVAALLAFVLIHFRGDILDLLKRSIAGIGGLFGGAK